MLSRAVGPCVVLGLSITMGLPSGAVAQRLGYAWADNPTARTYAPSATYAYNASGGALRITRTGIGSYTVTFEGLGGKGRAGGHVQVTAYGPGNETCKVVSWGSGESDFVVNVGCFNPAGGPVDTRYTVLVVAPEPPAIRPMEGVREPVQRRILPGDTVEIRYPNGRIVKRFPGGSKTIEPDGRISVAMHVDVRPAFPPALPSDPQVVDWLESHSAALLDILRALVDDTVSVSHYLAAEGDVSLYEETHKRTRMIHGLLRP